MKAGRRMGWLGFAGANTDGVRNPYAVLAAPLSAAEFPAPSGQHSARPPCSGECAGFYCDALPPVSPLQAGCGPGQLDPATLGHKCSGALSGEDLEHLLPVPQHGDVPHTVDDGELGGVGQVMFQPLPVEGRGERVAVAVPQVHRAVHLRQVDIPRAGPRYVVPGQADPSLAQALLTLAAR